MTMSIRNFFRSVADYRSNPVVETVASIFRLRSMLAIAAALLAAAVVCGGWNAAHAASLKSADGVTAFETAGECSNAFNAKTARGYEAETVRENKAGRKMKTLAELDYPNGYCRQAVSGYAKGLYLYFAPTFKVGVTGKTVEEWRKSSVMFDCLNHFEGEPQVPKIIAASTPAPAASAVMPVACSGELQPDGSCFEHRTQFVIVDTVPMRRCATLYPIEHECKFKVGTTTFASTAARIECPTCGVSAQAGNFTLNADNRCTTTAKEMGGATHVIVFGEAKRQDSNNYGLFVHSVDGRVLKTPVWVNGVSGAYVPVTLGANSCQISTASAVNSHWQDVLRAASLPTNCSL